MKRVVVFLPSAAVKACDSLADRYGSNRSEVVRLAVAEGMPAAVEALERLRDLRLVKAAGAGASRLWRVQGVRKRRGRGRPRKVLDADPSQPPECGPVAAAGVEAGASVRGVGPCPAGG